MNYLEVGHLERIHSRRVENYLPSQLRFYAEKTAVHSGENWSSFGGKLQFGAEKLFQNSRITFHRFGFCWGRGLHRVVVISVTIGFFLENPLCNDDGKYGNHRIFAREK